MSWEFVEEHILRKRWWYVAEEDEIREVTIDCLISQEHRSMRRPFPSLLVRDGRT